MINTAHNNKNNHKRHIQQLKSLREAFLLAHRDEYIEEYLVGRDHARSV